MKNKKDSIIYTGLDKRKLKREYKNQLKKSWFAKNIIPNEDTKKSIISSFIKFFVKIILWLATPKLVWKNRSKTDELINRTYNKFSSNDFTFIPVSLAFYFLVSFVPILTILIMLLSLVKNYDQLFIGVILEKIIPGAKAIMKIPSISVKNAAQYTPLILLFIGSIWIASGGFAKFIYSQNYIFGHENLGNWITNRLKGLLVVLGISFYLFLSSTLYLFVYEAFSKNLSSHGKDIFFYLTFSFYLVVILYLGLSLLYKLTPGFVLSWNQVYPGVLITLFPMLIFIMIFGYLTSLINYEKYGAIGTFMYIAVFVLFLSYFLFLGTIVNEANYKTYHSTYTISKRKWFGSNFKF